MKKIFKKILQLFRKVEKEQDNPKIQETIKTKEEKNSQFYIQKIDASNIPDRVQDPNHPYDQNWKNVSKEEFIDELYSLTNATKLLHIAPLNGPIGIITFVRSPEDAVSVSSISMDPTKITNELTHTIKAPQLFAKYVQVQGYPETVIIDENLPEQEAQEKALKEFNEKVGDTLCKNIISTLFKYGWTHHCLSGFNLNISKDQNAEFTPEFEIVSDKSTGEKNSNEYIKKAIKTKPLAEILGYEPKRDIFFNSTNIDAIFNNVLGLLSIHRHQSEYIVTNIWIATQIQSSSLFTYQKTEGKFGITDIYCIGKYMGVDVWVDPWMTYDDTRVLLGFKHKADEDGIMLCSYVIKECMVVMDDDTVRKIIGKSRYDITPVGFNPEKSYFTFWIDPNVFSL